MRAPTLLARGTEVIVRWKGAGANGSPITGYLVDISRGRDRTRPGSARRAVFKRLEPGRYTFRVAATNGVGTSPYSARARIRIER